MPSRRARTLLKEPSARLRSTFKTTQGATWSLPGTRWARVRWRRLCALLRVCACTCRRCAVAAEEVLAAIAEAAGQLMCVPAARMTAVRLAGSQLLPLFTTNPCATRLSWMPRHKVRHWLAPGCCRPGCEQAHVWLCRCRSLCAPWQSSTESSTRLRSCRQVCSIALACPAPAHYHTEKLDASTPQAAMTPASAHAPPPAAARTPAAEPRKPGGTGEGDSFTCEELARAKRRIMRVGPV